MKAIGLFVFGAILVLSVAIPITIQVNAQTQQGRAQEVLAQQAQDLARLTTDNERLSNLVAGSKSDRALSDGQVAELLSLRGELGRLMSKTNEARRLTEQNRLLRGSAPTNTPARQSQLSPAELEAELSRQTIDAMRGICLELPAALQKFANDHGNLTPSVPEIRNYFPTASGRKMPGLYTFNFVRDGGPQPGDSLVLYEESSRLRQDGKKARVYGFLDGTAVEVVGEDRDFEDWVRDHLAPGVK